MVTAFDVEQVTNGAKSTIDVTLPYRVEATVTGISPVLFHAYNPESVEAKGKAAKNSTAKKTDDIESYAYRTRDGYLGIPALHFVAAMVEAGRYMQDPRSPRKSARDLCRAGIVPLMEVAPFSTKTKKWDYEDKRRVMVQRNAITRVRPAMEEGWKLSFTFLVNTPEYLPPLMVHQLLSNAGRLVGVCDFRPTYGRFNVTSWEELPAV